jgi:hypothetical protein
MSDERIPLLPPIDVFEDGMPMATLVVTEYANPPYPKALYALDPEGCTFCRISVNLPELVDILGENEFFIKSWNSDVCKALVERGILVPTGRHAPGDFAEIPICTFHKEKCHAGSDSDEPAVQD